MQTIEKQQAKNLLFEKKQLQARLREVDKLLRNLDILWPGLVAIVRTEI